MSKTMQAAENRASQGGKPANEGAYFLYVTEICRCSQRRKQNYTVILRLRDFFDGLGLTGPRSEPVAQSETRSMAMLYAPTEKDTLFFSDGSFLSTLPCRSVRTADRISRAKVKDTALSLPSVS